MAEFRLRIAYEFKAVIPWHVHGIQEKQLKAMIFWIPRMNRGMTAKIFSDIHLYR